MKISKSAVNRAGDVIRKGPKSSGYNEAISLLNDWRESYGPVMDKYYDRCVELANKLDPENIIVAQRLKRLPTIIGKLQRFKTMRLANMQDIAGVRIIAEDMKQLRIIEKEILSWENLYKVSNYLNDGPKPSGYRGEHFIMKDGDRLVEIQLRTQLQHLWATSVETVDIYRGSAMKTSSDNTYWHEFFCQVSSAFAFVENANPGPKYDSLNIENVRDDLRETIFTHNIYDTLEAIRLTNLVIEDEKIRQAYYVVINLDYAAKNCQVLDFKESEYDSAVGAYTRLERASTGQNMVVLVAVNNIRDLQEIYPNYFMNLKDFSDIIRYILEKSNV